MKKKRSLFKDILAIGAISFIAAKAEQAREQKESLMEEQNDRIEELEEKLKLILGDEDDQYIEET